MTALARAAGEPAVRLPAPRPPAARPDAAPARGAGSLRLVPARPAEVRRGPFVALVLGLLGAGLLALLALNTVLAQDAFRLHALKVQGKVLTDREQELQAAVEALQAPRAIDQRATALGMVPGGPPEFLELPSGRLLGAPDGAPGSTPTPTAAPVVPAGGDGGTGSTGTTGQGTTGQGTTGQGTTGQGTTGQTTTSDGPAPGATTGDTP